VGAAITLRHFISSSGTRLKSGDFAALTPLPSVKPPSIVLTQRGVVPLLTRAVHIGTALVAASPGSEAASAAAAVVRGTQEVLAALRAHGDRARVYGVTPLFSTCHPPLTRVLGKHAPAEGCVPGQPLVTNGGAGVRLLFSVPRYLRRVEPTGDNAQPGRVFNWDTVGSRWLRRAHKRGQNGAGLRTLKRDRRAWWCHVPGAYHMEGVPRSWRPWMDSASCISLDPGIRLLLCSPQGLAVTKAQWYQQRHVWQDYCTKPAVVGAAEAQLAKEGGQSQAPGVLAFSEYVKAFSRAYPTMEDFYCSRTQCVGRERKLDKLRSALDRILHWLAPRPQGVCVCARAGGGGRWAGADRARCFAASFAGGRRSPCRVTWSCVPLCPWCPPAPRPLPPLPLLTLTSPAPLRRALHWRKLRRRDHDPVRHKGRFPRAAGRWRRWGVLTAPGCGCRGVGFSVRGGGLPGPQRAPRGPRCTHMCVTDGGPPSTLPTPSPHPHTPPLAAAGVD